MKNTGKLLCTLFAILFFLIGIEWNEPEISGFFENVNSEINEMISTLIP